jgi:opacity protein-like surface antigen
MLNLLSGSFPAFRFPTHSFVLAAAVCLTAVCLTAVSSQAVTAQQCYDNHFGGDYFDAGAGQFDARTKFDANAKRPLGGLFAPDFTRTLSFFGGWNRVAQFANEPGVGGQLFDDDFSVGVAYGRRHSHFLRSEFEFTHRSNQTETFASPAIPLPAPVLDGEAEVYSIMKNFLIEFPANNNRITPYVGIGIGLAYVDLDLQQGAPIEADSNSAFAYQPIGGLGIDVSERAEFFVEYRYFRTTELELSGGSGGDLSGNYDAHNLFVGLRFEF